MDWSAVFTALGGTGVIVAAAAFFMKRWVQRTIDLRFDRLRELDAAEIRETFRRRAGLHDDQVAQFQAVLELVGRIRDAAFRAHEAAENGWSLEMNESFRSIGSMYEPLRDLVHKGRAVLPLEAFVVVHEMQNPVRQLVYMAAPDDEVLPEFAGYSQTFRDEVLAAAEKINLAFQYLTSVARALRGAAPIPGATLPPEGPGRVISPQLGAREPHDLSRLSEFMSYHPTKPPGSGT